jgi:hypothetical protein
MNSVLFDWLLGIEFGFGIGIFINFMVGSLSCFDEFNIVLLVTWNLIWFRDWHFCQLYGR